MLYVVTSPSDAAQSLDLGDLPVGTVVALVTDRGYNGAQRITGEITKVTDRSYIVESVIHGRSRVGRSVPDRRARSLRVLLTPDEAAEYREAKQRENADINAKFAASEAERIETERRRVARSLGAQDLIDLHPEEYNRLVEARLAASSGA